ncbi:hypothetical protein FA95DRAFT_1603819 [Auriscalpium vulgare]|uniref:Uncharacterized protein n=1 Tax=Auriscalpium vulgare TaxID=40419 RepID=A0ACB8S0X5_9AGAM|nr:hypothetical protein FA95DRAFT_1603819 [Auriscalpium vulgare]
MSSVPAIPIMPHIAHAHAAPPFSRPASIVDDTSHLHLALRSGCTSPERSPALSLPPHPARHRLISISRGTTASRSQHRGAFQREVGRPQAQVCRRTVSACATCPRDRRTYLRDSEHRRNDVLGPDVCYDFHSGSFTHSVARTVGSAGKVHSYEFHEARASKARKKFSRRGMANIVSLTHRNVCMDGFTVAGTAGAEQVLRTVSALNESGFTDITMYETLLRPHGVYQVPVLPSVSSITAKLKDAAAGAHARRGRG